MSPDNHTHKSSSLFIPGELCDKPLVVKQVIESVTLTALSTLLYLVENLLGE